MAQTRTDHDGRGRTRGDCAVPVERGERRRTDQRALHADRPGEPELRRRHHAPRVRRAAGVRRQRHRRQDRRALGWRLEPRREPGVRRSRAGDRAAGQAGSGDEGTAMLEIIHDLAPGAQLYFATAFTSITSFANNIRALRAAGCDIIVDDVFYFVETPFQDGQAPGVISTTNGGVVTQAVNDVTAAGALYFSSAGNEGNLNASTSGTWEGDFVDGGTVRCPCPRGTACTAFGAQTFDTLSRAAAPSPDQPVLVGSARRLGQRLRPVPAEQRRHAGAGQLDEHPERHAGSLRAAERRRRQRRSADRDRQEGQRREPVPAPRHARRCLVDCDRRRNARPRRRRGRRVRRGGDARGRAVPAAVQCVERGRDLQLGRTPATVLPGERHAVHAGQRVLDRRHTPPEAGHHGRRRSERERRRRFPVAVLRHVGGRAARRRDRGPAEIGERRSRQRRSARC